jgi:hypothetical protein
MKCVEITARSDGTFTVVECEPETPAMEGQEGEMPGESFQSAEEAMQAAMTLLSGESRQTEEEAMMSAQKGYGPKNGRPTPQQVFGEGM